MRRSLPAAQALAAALALATTLAPPAHAQVEQFCLGLNTPALANQYVMVPVKTGLESGTMYTLEAWVYPTAYTNFPTIVSNGFSNSFWLGLNTSGKVRFYPAGSAHGYMESLATIPLNQWTHVAATYDTSSGARIVVNGVTDNFSSAFRTPAPTDTMTFCVGADRGAAGTNFYWRGYLDEVRVWNFVRSDFNIGYQMTHQVGGATLFPSAYYVGMVAQWTFERAAVAGALDYAYAVGYPAHNAVFVNGDYYSLIHEFGAPVAVNEAIDFGGLTDYVDTGVGDGFSGGLTLEAWLLTPGSLVFPADYQTIVGRNFLSSFWLGLTPDLHLRFYPTGGGGKFVDSDQPIQANRWTHVSATYKDGAIALYVNGAPVPFHGAAISGPVGENGQTAWVGADPPGDYFFHGEIDEVYITRGRLSPQSIVFANTLGSAATINPVHSTDQDGVSREAWHIDMDATQQGVHGNSASVLRSGAPLIDPFFMTTMTGRFPYYFDLAALAGPALDPPTATVSSSTLEIPYDTAIPSTDVFVVATTTDLSLTRVRLTSPGGAHVVDLLQPGTTTGRDLHTIFYDTAPATVATAHSPFTGTVQPAQPLGVLTGTSSSGTWTLEVSGSGVAGSQIICWGLNFGNRAVSVGGPAPPARATLAVRGANPLRGLGTLEFRLPREAQVDLALFDVGGRRIAQLYSGRASAGATLIRWNSGRVGPGVYFARLDVDGRSTARAKLAVVR